MAEHYFTRRPSSRPRMGVIRCNLRGHPFKFLTSSGVFSHRRIDLGTQLLIESMILPEVGSALDLGCGYGPVGIAAAKLRPCLEVWMTDVNSRVISLAEENARRNGVGNVRLLAGSLYEPVEDLVFDAILTNPPFSAGIGRAIEPIVEGSNGHLKRGGSLQIVVRTTKGGSSISELLERYYGEYEVYARRSGFRVLRAEKR